MAVITLKRPVEHEGRTYSEITIDEPTVAGIEAFETARSAGAAEISATLALLSAETRVPVEALRKLKVSDLAKINETLAPFMSLETGGSGG